MKRVLVGGMAHESDSFNPITAGRDDFHVLRGEELLRRRVDNDAMTGILDTLEARGYEPVPALFTHAVPNGLVDKEFYLDLKAEFLQMARAALEKGPIDAVCLELHGSMTAADGYGEAEGPLLEELRALLPGVPILSSLDMHATMTEKMHANCDGFAAFKCAPHTDQRETGVRAAEMTIAALERGIVPRSAWVRVPLLLAGEQSSTTVEPMLSLTDELRRCERQPGILAASYLMGYPWCDGPDCSAGVYVTAEDQSLADREALRLAELIWSRRREFCFQTETLPEGAAVDAALRAALDGPRPVYLSDSGDNPTAGSSSDCTGLLRRLLEDPRTGLLGSPALYGGIYDPEAAAACVGRVGETLTLTFGARFDRTTSAPVTAKGQVASCLEDWRGFGPVALFRTQGVDVVLSRAHIGYTSPELFTALGRDPAGADLVVCKLGYLTAAHAAVARRSIMALSGGSTNEDLASLPYRRIPRPIFPLDPDCPFRPRTS